MVETFRGVVRPHHLDHMEHMNVQWYAKMFDDATWHFFAHLGMTGTYFRDEACGMAALKQVTEYKAEAVAGDLLVCHSKLLKADKKTVHLFHTLSDAVSGHVVATTELLAVHLDTLERRSCPIPDHIRKRCNEVIIDTSAGRED